MMLEPLDLVLRFDASGSKVLLLVPRSPEELGTLKRFFEIPVAAEVSVADFAKEIGVAVASFMHARHGDHFKLEEQDPETANATESLDVTFDDARLLIDRLSDSSTMADIDAVSVLLEQASKTGDHEATEYLQNLWPGLRKVFVRRVSRRT